MKYDLIEQNNEYLLFKFTGMYSLTEAEELVKKMHGQCLERKFDKLLADITEIEGVIPNMDRFSIGESIAEVFKHNFKSALLAKKDLINYFTENVAVNRGARFKIFSDEAEAIAWLME